ncbi:MAG: hypothetical protein ABIG85_03680 [Chloroflexota bacterium]
MSDTIQKTIDTLKQMRLPELRARYAEVIGEESNCPNKTWLARKIAEAEAQGGGAAPAATDEAPPDDDAEAQPEEVHDEPQDDGAATEDVKLSKLSIPELQQRYRDVVGRDTSSSHSGYLKWKIRQAEKGRIPVGPRGARRADGEAPDFKVLPLRMEADLVTQLDEARERLGLSSRMELFRRSLHAFLLEAGEVRVAEMFAPEA